MFYTRINKIKVFNNREGFLGLFNRSADMRIYSYVSNPAGTAGSYPESDGTYRPLTVSELLHLDEKQREDRLLEQVLAEAGLFAQSKYLEVNGVKDSQTLLFGEAGLVIYSSDHIPDELDIRLLVIESDADVRNFALEADKVLDSDAFKGLLIAVETALTVTNPILSGAIAIGGVAVNLLRQKLRANQDDLVGYWQLTLNRTEHYPHGVRDRQDVYDTTGNILVDYTLFGFENEIDRNSTEQ
jgi:hypothetical protein